MKPKKCSYKYCNNPDDFDPELAIKDNNKYYHLECFEKKEAKNKVFNMFCDYVKNKEDGLFIRKIISKWIDKDGVSPNFLLFTMNYIIENKIPLVSIFGVGIVMKRDKVIKEYTSCLEKYKTTKIDIKTQNFNFEKNNQGGWRELIG